MRKVKIIPRRKQIQIIWDGQNNRPDRQSELYRFQFSYFSQQSSNDPSLGIRVI